MENYFAIRICLFKDVILKIAILIYSVIVYIDFIFRAVLVLLKNYIEYTT